MDQSRRKRSRRALNTPVVSIGALTMGGAGKSPMVLHLARRLRDMGRNPAILTRGYKRMSTEPIVIVPRGEVASVESTGDEAQMFVRAGDAHVGIGADRYEVGRLMEAELAPDIFLLDDGFQHVQLHRDHDVVLMDANDPEAGGLFPVGLLREPLSALARASEIMITRVAADQSVEAIERIVRKYNSEAPISRSSVIPIEWIESGSGIGQPIAESRLGHVAAFCGLGDPGAFWRTLEDLGTELGMRREFADHHRYTATELKQIAREAAGVGANTLVTTEKDAMNLCHGAAELVAPMKLLWLRIGIEIADQEKFLRRMAGERVKTV